MDSQKLQKIFTLGQLGLIALIVLVAWLLRRPRQESGFRVREADLEAQRKTRKPTREKRPDPKLSLEGLRLDGEPHEILGVRRSTSASEIQKAFRDLMKRYHPDKIGPPGSPEWKEAQKITQIILQAKEKLLKSAQR